MPQLYFKGIEKQEVCTISKRLVDELEKLLECPRDYFILEVANNSFICDGEATKIYPIIEVKWFDRGQELQDKVAEIITKKVRSLGFNMVDVYFIPLQKNSYYENGEHF